MEEYITGRFTELLDAILPKLDPNEQPGRVIAVVPGMQISWDDCCAGQLAGRLVSLTPVMAEGAPMNRCVIKYWQAIGEVTLLRCSTALNDDGTFPTPVQVQTEAQGLLTESAAIIKACTEMDWISSVSTWTPLGPNGGCAGVSLQFTFNLDGPK